jgi:hypothetical protein
MSSYVMVEEIKDINKVAMDKAMKDFSFMDTEKLNRTVRSLPT